MKVLNAYSKRNAVTVDCSKDKVLTEQSHKQMCEINNILRKYQKTGVIEHVNKHKPSYGFASSVQFQEAMETVTVAQQMFDDLPSGLRNRFSNDPAQFLDFVQNPENEEEMIKMGLANRRPQEPQEAQNEQSATPHKGSKEEQPDGTQSGPDSST